MFSTRLKYPKNYLNAYCGDGNFGALKDLPLQYIAVLRSFPIKYWLTIKITNNVTGEVKTIREDVPAGSLRRKSLWFKPEWSDYLPPLELSPLPTGTPPDYEYDEYAGEIKIKLVDRDRTFTGTTRCKIPHTFQELYDEYDHSGLTYGELYDYDLSYEQLNGL